MPDSLLSTPCLLFCNADAVYGGLCCKSMFALSGLTCLLQFLCVFSTFVFAEQGSMHDCTFCSVSNVNVAVGPGEFFCTSQGVASLLGSNTPLFYECSQFTRQKV